MKKFFIMLICCISVLCTSAYANELKFEPVGGGKFIYCNNPEGIEDDMLLNGENPRWIMNNEDLTPDLYYIYLSHFNYTGSGTLGYDIELDMAMTAKEDSKIIIHKAFFETPWNYAYYKDWNKTVAETDWGQLQVCASMLGIPMCDIRGEDFYYPWEYEPITIEIKKGERYWLSDYLRNYQKVGFGKGMHIQALVELESGLMDFDVGAVKSVGFDDYRPEVSENIAFGEYRWDYTLKGIADTLPEVETDIEYTIDADTEDGERIPVLLKNQYIPEGHTVTGWYTQLNPQNDIWSKATAAESDILTLRYKDDTKLGFYGSGVSENKKDNVWIFDTLHSAVRKYEQRYGTGTEKDFEPNFLLGTEKDNHAYACNIGNYGVATTYNMSVTNNTDVTKYCSLVLTAASEVIAYATDANGEKTYAYVKDLTGEKVTDNMLSYEIPPQSTEEFKFSLILPVNYNGGIKNELVITDENIQAVDFIKKKIQVDEERRQSDYRSTNVFYGDYVESIFPRFPEETDEKVWKSRSGFEYLRGRNNGIIRWRAWDGAPEWYYNLWGYVSTVYMLDEEYNITSSYTFPSLPCGASYDDGYFYIKTARDGVFKSADGAEWIKTDESLPEYTPYYDLSRASEWAVPELERGWDLGLRLKNIAGDAYNFKQPMLREAFCELAVQVLDKVGGSADISAGIKFEDISNPNVERLAGLGIIEGYGDGTFRPNEYITREQAAVILRRMVKCVGYSYAEDEFMNGYTDYDEISEWARDGVNVMTNLGIMNGVGESKFDPKGTYTREQSAATMVRLYEMFIELE